MKKDIREKIEELFWQNSFSDLSMDEVAKNLWLKKASLYHHFKSKDDMFLQVLDFSYLKYKWFLEQIFLLNKLETILENLIKLPFLEKNLFAVVSQKWYCHLDWIRKYIGEKNAEISNIFKEKFWDKNNINDTKMILLRSTIDDLGKKYCIFDCPSSSNFWEIIDEIIKIYF